jgi:hypothetical protein
MLREVYVSGDRMALKFVVDEGEEIIARCDADCCSYTWVEGVEMCRLPATVKEVEDIAMPEVGEPGKQGGKHHGGTYSVAFYGLKITTSRGHIVIDYRNDSNGYYGGSLSWPGDRYFYGGVHGQNDGTLANWTKQEE